MRLLVAAFALVMAMGALAQTAKAASAYDDVPTDHWAYNALDYLTEKGVLEGYPGGFFKGDRTLTRYEFAQAIARLLDTIQQKGATDEVKVMVDSLRTEFSDQLAAQNKAIDALNKSVTDNTSQINDLQGKVDAQDSKISALETKVNGMKAGPDWKGSFTYRWQFDRRDDGGASDRFRQQILFKLGYSKQINDEVLVGFRLGTQTGISGVSPATTLGGTAGPFDTSAIFLDQAYFKYTPNWFGYYTEAGCDSKCSPKIDLWAGIIPNPLYDPNEFILDKDINLQGAAFVYHFDKDFSLTGAASAVVEKPGGFISDDTYLFAVELKKNNLFTCGLDAWVGAYVYQQEGNLDVPFGTPAAADPFFDNGFVHTAPALYGAPFAGTTQRLTGRFSSDFFIVRGGAQYTFKDVMNKPLAVFGEYMVNTQAADVSTGRPLRAPAPAINVPLLAANDDIGWLVGAQWGPVPTEVGQWYWSAKYREIGSNANIDGFGQSEAGGSNVNSLEVKVGTMVYKNSMFGISYWLNKMHNAYGYSIPAGREDQQSLRFDWSFKF
jgi:uncharacterized coiled-coil protein SlyX